MSGFSNPASSGGSSGAASFTEITDGSNTASVKAASTPSAATDKALVVDIRPGNLFTDDASGNLKTAEQYVTGWSYSNLGVSAGTTIKSGAGVLHLIAINRPIASGTITIYDNTTASGTKIATITLPASIVSDVDELFYDAGFSTGLTVVTTGTNIDVTVIYA